MTQDWRSPVIFIGRKVPKHYVAAGAFRSRSKAKLTVAPLHCKAENPWLPAAQGTSKPTYHTLTVWEVIHLVLWLFSAAYVLIINSLPSIEYPEVKSHRTTCLTLTSKPTGWRWIPFCAGEALGPPGCSTRLGRRLKPACDHSYCCPRCAPDNKNHYEPKEELFIQENKNMYWNSLHSYLLIMQVYWAHYFFIKGESFLSQMFSPLLKGRLPCCAVARFHSAPSYLPTFLEATSHHPDLLLYL